jgi:serine/threonine protein kinase
VRFVAPDGAVTIEPIGTGSVFDVALVREAGALVVCKRLTPRAAREAEGRAAIVREAKLLAAARHPALPALVRVGADAHGPFLLETRAEGRSLRELCDAWGSRGRLVPPRLVGHVAAASFEALAELSELRDEAGPLALVHGDLGPDHVLLGPTGEIRFVDLGAARWRDMEGAASPAERGTLPYVAPEVARGDAPPSASGDVYALAATLLFLATGEPPCDARDEAAMLVEIGERGVRLERLAGVAAFDDAERAALRAALEPDPSRRLGRARELADAFARGGRARSV